MAAASCLCAVKVAALVSQGKQDRQILVSKSLVEASNQDYSAFPRPKILRENYSSKREIFLFKVKWLKLENLQTAVNLIQCTQPHNAFPTQRTPLNNYSLCKPASFSSQST